MVDTKAVVTNEITAETIAVLKVEVREIKRNDGSGQSFNAYKTFKKDGKKIDLKFVKEVKNAPTEDSYIKVALGNMNIDKNREFPVMWVKQIIDVTPLTSVKRSPEDYKNLADSFSTENDLPFKL